MTGPGRGLERRYRRLLGWYPAEHRHAYEDEMLGVLLAGARPGQRYPRLGETVNLVLSATRARLGRAGTGLPDSRWADAVAVLGVLASVLMLARSVRAIGYGLTWSVRFGDTLPWIPAWTHWVRAVAWAAITVAVLAGWRVVAAVGAWAAVLGELVLLVWLPAYPFTEPLAVWPLLLTVIAAALLSVPGGARRGMAVLGGPRAALFGAAGAVAVGGPIVLVFLWTEAGAYVSFAQDRLSLVSGRTYAAVAAIVVATIASLAPPVRRRTFVLLAPMAAALTILQLGFPGPFSGMIYVQPPVLTVGLPWSMLAVVPPIVLLAGVLVVRRRERGSPS